MTADRGGDDAPAPGPEDTLLEFPCDFPIKVMGRATDDFRSLAIGIVSRHFGAQAPEHIEERPSSAASTCRSPCTVRAESKAQLDALYRELTSCQPGAGRALKRHFAAATRAAGRGASTSATVRRSAGPPRSLSCVIRVPRSRRD